TLEGIAPLVADAPPSLAIKKRFLARRTSRFSRELLGAMAASGVWQERIAELRNAVAALEQTDYAPPPLVSGDDLTAAGLQPGPLFKRVLEAVYDAQLEDRVRSKQEAMELAMRLAASL